MGSYRCKIPVSSSLYEIQKIALCRTAHLFRLVGWLVGFYGILTFVGYLMPNPFLYK